MMESYSNRANIQTLETASDLKNVSYGHRYPRHGLRLLHWLANNWIKFDSKGKMFAEQDPGNGEYGFHPFYNKEQILPKLYNRSRYFEVGNLNSSGAHNLPFKEAPTGGDQSNTDRIIVRLDSGLVVGAVYITEHVPHLKSFSRESTYRISKNLIHSAKNKSPESFLKLAGYVGRNSQKTNETHYTTINVEEELPRNKSPERKSLCSCIIL